MRKLGLKIFPIESNIVDKELAAKSSDIGTAAYNILNEWFKDQGNPCEAYRTLLHYLEEIKMNRFAQDLKEIVEGKNNPSNDEHVTGEKKIDSKSLNYDINF